MEEEKSSSTSKGGRPQKPFKRDQLLDVKCTLVERKVIEYKAEIASLTTSKYLMQLGITGKIGFKPGLFFFTSFY